MPDAYLSSLDAPERAMRWERMLARAGGREMVYVAEEEGLVVGFAAGGPERDGNPLFRGELYAIYLLHSAQREGWGRALVAAVSNNLLAHGIRDMLVWVLRDNRPARRFYERLGGRYLSSRILEFEGISVPEVSYGWPDVRDLT
jgi:GNAT superfamily N-acetyltransferase